MMIIMAHSLPAKFFFQSFDSTKNIQISLQLESFWNSLVLAQIFRPLKMYKDCEFYSNLA